MSPRPLSFLAALATALLFAASAGADIARCSPEQQRISRETSAATGKSASAHVSAHFTPKGSYLVNDYVYQNFVKGKPKLGRPQGADSYLFVAGGAD